MTVNAAPAARSVPAPVLSTQVSGSRYFFLRRSGGGGAGLEPAYGGFEQCNPDYVVQRERPGFTAVELVVGGAGWVHLNGRVTSLRPGVMFSYDPRTRLEIRTEPEQPMAKYFLCFGGARAARRLRVAGLAAGTAVRLAMYPEVQHGFEELIREGQHHRASTGRICAALVEVMLLKVEQLAGLAGQQGHEAEETFLLCRTLIETRTAELATLSDIVRVTAVEPTRLCRLFRRFQGLSPYQYLLRCKMALAAERLMAPGVLVKEVAAQVGFADPYHFSRVFKQVHHLSPAGFRQRAVRSGESD